MLASFTKAIILFSLVISAQGRNAGYNGDSTDFLLHEAGGRQTAPKQDYVASDFPPLGPPPSSKTTSFQQNQPSLPNPTSNPGNKNVQQSSGKRDYVAPKFTSTTRSHGNQQGSKVKDLIDVYNNNNPQNPTLKPPPGPTLQNGQKQGSTNTVVINNHQQPSGKRDYVAPQFTSTTPSHGIILQGSNVKDLINVFNNNNNPQTPSTPSFSYSSVLRGKGGQNQPPNANGPTATTPTQKPTLSPKSPATTKPPNFNTVVAGSNKPNSFVTTHKPPTRPFSHNNNRNQSPTPRPLPSSFVNNNNKETGNTPSDAELLVISEELLRKDTNNAAKLITVNFQEKTNSQSKEDKAPLPLLVIPDNVWNMPTIQKFVPLLDNYERDTLVNEYVTPQEKNEENAFMDAIMSTSVIRHLMTFLKEKGYVTPDPRQQRDFLKQLWFSLYSRGKGKISSSGFEHIFVSELKNGEVSGLHNWLYFGREESAHRANYLGYLKYVQFNDKGAVLKFHFNQQGVDKPVDTMFVGTSPELEIALYTLCFVTRADKDCRLKLGSKDVNIISHTFRYRSKNLIGSAYPQI